MNSSVVRQIQIDIITDTYNPIVDWFNHKCSDLIPERVDVYYKDGREIVYYKPSYANQWLFYRDDSSNCLWCNFDFYWRDFNDKFGIDYFLDCQGITKFLLEILLNESVPLPYFIRFTDEPAIIVSALDKKLSKK